MNKRMHFNSKLVPVFLSGDKTTTWRLWDDKSLSVGDVVDFLESGTEKHFAKVKLTSVVEKKMGKITEDDEANIGHEPYPDNFKAYSEYYGKKVTAETLVKVIRFEVIN